MMEWSSDMLAGFFSKRSTGDHKSQPAPTMSIEPRAVDENRPVRVVIIGAGISGILACIRLVQRIPNLELCIYEKNADIGGTWFEVRLKLPLKLFVEERMQAYS